MFGQESCSAPNSLKLIPPAEAGKGEGKEEIFSGISVTSDTSDTMAPGAGRGEGREIPDEGGRERESATTFATPGVWRISDVNSEIYASWRCWRTKVERLWRGLKLGADDQLSHGICVLPAQNRNGGEPGILPRVLDQRRSIFAVWRRVWRRRKLKGFQQPDSRCFRAAPT